LRIWFGLSALFLTFLLGSTSVMAAETGSLPNFPPGLTIGIAAGTLPEAPGVYWTEKNFFTTIQAVNNGGHDTGAHLESYATVAIVQFVPGWTVLGAKYAFQLDSYGLFQAQLDYPKAAHLASRSTVGASDLAIRPVILSWNLPDHVFLGVREGVYVPVGTYDPLQPVNISHHRYTFEQGLALSYVPRDWVLSANGVIDVNSANEAAVVKGVSERYTSGATFNVDLTALRQIGAFQIGPVGFYGRQFSADVGPQNLNAESPVEGAAGPLVGYKFKYVYLNLYGVQDISARNVGKQSRLWFTASVRVPGML